MAMTSDLNAVYRATTYRVFLPGGLCELRIGVACPALAAWLAAEGYAAWAVITAHNPGSQPAGDARNAERQAQLEGELLEGNYEPYAAENAPDADDWPVEESCFVPDIAVDDACALAADYGQKAIVCGGPDGIPQLQWIEDGEP